MRTVLALLLLTGCSANDPDGVWVAFADDIVEDEAVDPTVAHNYLDAQVPVDTTPPDDWTMDQISDLSEQVMFMEIFEVADLEDDFAKTMIVNGAVLLGVEEEDGSWTFSWTYSENNAFTQTHVSGYTFTERDTAQIVWSVNLTFEDSIATGDVRLDLTEGSTWDESDLWDDVEIGTNNGETPSDDYLVHVSDSSAVDNDGDSTDCSATICNLSVTDVEGGGGRITLRATDLTHDEFEAVYGSEQGAGIPNLF